MAYLKLDCRILRSTVWFDKAARDVFLTALLMAEPLVTDTPDEQLEVRTLNPTGWVVPPGKYGFVAASGQGIAHAALVDPEMALDALERLGSAEPESRSKAHGGRRLVRVDGGYIALNFWEYRMKDHTAAERKRRQRERESNLPQDGVSRVTSQSVTQAEAEAEKTKAKTSRRSAPSSPTVLGVEFPEALDTPAFRSVWEAWKTHRSEIHKKLTPSTAAGQLKKLASWGQTAAIQSIQQSIDAGWVGLFAPKPDLNEKPQDVGEDPWYLQVRAYAESRKEERRAAQAAYAAKSKPEVAQ